MRLMMRFQQLMAVVLPLLSFGRAASVVSSSTCTSDLLADKVANFKVKLSDDGFLNGDTIAVECDFGFEPLDVTTNAVCVEGVWQIPANFQCVSKGHCRPLVKPGPGVKVIRTIQRNKNQPNKNIFENDEHIIVKCSNSKLSATKNSSFTQSFKCVQGSWEPPIEPPCQHLPCPALPVLDNGSFALVSEDVAEPLCNNNGSGGSGSGGSGSGGGSGGSGSFQLRGSKSLYCQNGSWVVRPDHAWPTCVRNEVTKTPRTPLEQLQWIGLRAGVLVLIGAVVLVLFCYLRKDSPKRNRLMHSTSHVDELLHLRRTKPIVIPDPVSHTQVHYTHDRKPIPVTSL